MRYEVLNFVTRQSEMGVPLSGIEFRFPRWKRLQMPEKHAGAVWKTHLLPLKNAFLPSKKAAADYFEGTAALGKGAAKFCGRATEYCRQPAEYCKQARGYCDRAVGLYGETPGLYRGMPRSPHGSTRSAESAVSLSDGPPAQEKREFRCLRRQSGRFILHGEGFAKLSESFILSGECSVPENERFH
jgi:hypothetical protein